MKAAVLYNKNDIRIEDLDKPVCGDNEVLISLKAIGVCGSDVHYYEHFGMGDSYKLKKPQILGHEPSGVIVETGKNVRNVRVTDRVTIEPGETCGKCFQCKTGHYNLCPEVQFLSTPDNKGAFAEYIVMDANMVYPIPDDMSFEVACLAEPLSVAITACRFVNATTGKTLLILGAGSIGLMILIAAKAFGVNKIIICDIQQTRLDVAKTIGATYTINVLKNNIIDEVSNITAEEGVDCCIEATGNENMIKSTIDVTRKGGKVALVGIPKKQQVDINIFEVIDKEIKIYGVFRYTNTYPIAVDILHNNMPDIKKIITGCFDLSETDFALRSILEDKKNTIKNIIVIK